MERITPNELERATLRKSLRGYDRKAVDALLHQAAESLAELNEQNEELRREIAAQADRLSRFEAEEGLLKEALILAQKAADDTRAAAQREADAIRQEARLQAEGERQDRQRNADDLRWEVERLRNDRLRFADDFRALLQRYLRELPAEARPLTVVEGAAAEA